MLLTSGQDGWFRNAYSVREPNPEQWYRFFAVGIESVPGYVPVMLKLPIFAGD